ncbi:YqeG family HAD IIIA-type phosphatase [Vaginisenegalia massiliensis]|uniref:YqeG family HAD IIIA-type phosphatase n=1 Tax=Vaginisenegalia massiliensis TaxID=2058294 RepID=UPI000F53BC64|nr:YqeG family HAD IIIA-type phosphatase [Vaginisenegalia massiliensis]
MKLKIKPTWMVNSVYDLKPHHIWDKGYRAVIVDLDNTMLAWNEYVYNQTMAEWIQEMDLAGLKVYLLSNNNVERVAKVAEPLQIPYQANALKPFPRHFRKAIEQLGFPKEKILVIGDQLLTDIVGANLTGVDSVLVKPLAQNDIIYTVINRRLERVLMKVLKIDRKADWGQELD